MNSGRILSAIGAAAVAVCLYTASASAAGKQFTWTTQSQEAKDNVKLAITAIETYKFGPMVAPFAQKAVAADANFAFGHYLLGASAPPPEAKPHLDRAVELAKTASEGEREYLNAVLLVRGQKFAEAVPILKNLEAKYPDERLVQMMLGQALFNSGQSAEAKPRFEKAIKLDGSTPRAYAFLASCYMLEDNYGKARQLFRKAQSLCSSDTAPFAPNYGLAFTFVYERKFDEAIQVLKAYEAQYTKVGGFPGLPAVFIYNSIGRLYLERGNPTEAIAYYKKGYDTVPSAQISDQDKMVWLGRLHHGTGRSLAKLGKHAEAWKEADTIKEMIEKGGDAGKEYWPSYHYIAGYLKYEAGDYKGAVEHMQQSEADDDPFRKLVLARSYEKLGDTENAMKLYKQIVEFRTSNIERALAYPEAKKKVKA